MSIMMLNPFIFQAGEPGILAAAVFSYSGSGTGCTIHSSKNIASITRNLQGVYDITFTAAFADADYAAVFGARYLAGKTTDTVPAAGGCANSTNGGHNLYSTTQYSLTTTDPGGSPADASFVSVVFYKPSALGAKYLAASMVTELTGATIPVLADGKNIASVVNVDGLYRYDRHTFTSALANANYVLLSGGRYASANQTQVPVGTEQTFTNGGTWGKRTTGIIDVNCPWNINSLGYTGSVMFSAADPPPGTLAAVYASISGGVVTILEQTNVASITRTAGGVYTINFTSPLATADYGLIGSTNEQNGFLACNNNTTAGRTTRSVNAVDVATMNASTIVLQEGSRLAVWVFDPSAL